MSLAKECMEDYEFTKGILLDIGALSRCDAHDDYIYSNDIESDRMYAMATERLKRITGYEAIVNMKEFHSLIKQVMDNYSLVSSECPYCQKSYNE